MPELSSLGNVKPTAASGQVRLDLDLADASVLAALWGRADLVVDSGGFTPELRGSGSNPTVSYINRAGRWGRVGPLLHIYVDVNVSTISGGSGDLLVDGWPAALPSIPMTQLGAFRSGSVAINAAARSVVGYNASGTALAAGEVRDNAPLVPIPLSAVKANSQLSWSMTFFL